MEMLALLADDKNKPEKRQIFQNALNFLFIRLIQREDGKVLYSLKTYTFVPIFMLKLTSPNVCIRPCLLP